MKNILLYIWQLPQHLLGIFLIKVLKPERRIYIYNEGKNYIVWYKFERKGIASKLSGASLGNYILLPIKNEATLKHEHGHSIQSRQWGWLYLPIVGIYSVLFCNLWDRLLHRSWSIYDRYYWYYKTKWTERQADRYGEVNRDNALKSINRPDNAKFPAVI